MESTCFDLDIADGVAHLRFNRPQEKNTLTPAFWSELPALIRDIDVNSKARVIVISSTGRHFSAGLDLSVFEGGMFRGDDAAQQVEPGRRRALLYQGIKLLQESFTAIERARIPVIAAIQGGCVGAAVSLAAACDMRYASSEAYFLMAEINIGITAEVGQLQRLPKVMPDALVREMAYRGTRLGAARAESVGFVNEVFADHDSLVANTLEIAREIAAKSPLAIWGAKHAIGFARDHSLDSGLDQIALWQAGMYYPDDCRESMQARQEQREPEYDELLKSPRS